MAYAQNISFHFTMSNQSGKQINVSFSQNSSFLLQVLSNVTNGVSQEISKMWKQLEANFIGFETNTQKEENILEQLVKTFDNDYYSKLLS